MRKIVLTAAAMMFAAISFNGDRAQAQTAQRDDIIRLTRPFAVEVLTEGVVLRLKLRMSPDGISAFGELLCLIVGGWGQLPFSCLLCVVVYTIFFLILL